MPQRPRSHVVADQASSAVARLFESAGHAVERVQNDYGEDLLVQTAHAGQMDAFRIWVQVKGTDDLNRHHLAADGYRFGFSAAHVRRWIRSIDTVLIVLWDVNRATGVFSYPRYLDEWALRHRRSVTLRFEEDSHLDEESVKVIVNRARVDHYDHLIRRMMSINDDRLHDEESDDGAPSWAAQAAATIALDFLEWVGIVEQDDESMWINPVTHEQFKDELLDAFANSEGERDSRATLTEAINVASILTIVKHVDELGDGYAVSLPLVTASAVVIQSLSGALDALEQALEDNSSV